MKKRSQIWWDNSYNKKFYSYIVMTISILLLTVLSLIKIGTFIEDQIRFKTIYEKQIEELEERKAIRQKEYEQWKSNPINAYYSSIRQTEIKKSEQIRLKELSDRYYKVGDKIIVMDYDTIIYDKTNEQKARRNVIGVDIIRDFTESGNIVGDKNIYLRDEIRKPTSNREYSDFLLMELKDELNKGE